MAKHLARTCKALSSISSMVKKVKEKIERV
jgi:hypothetical protein